MTKMPTITFRHLITQVKKLVFKAVRQKGSHIRFVHPDGRKTTIPDHGNKDVPKGFLRKIIQIDLDLEVEDFFEIMKSREIIKN